MAFCERPTFSALYWKCFLRLLPPSWTFRILWTGHFGVLRSFFNEITIFDGLQKLFWIFLAEIYILFILFVIACIWLCPKALCVYGMLIFELFQNFDVRHKIPTCIVCLYEVMWLVLSLVWHPLLYVHWLVSDWIMLKQGTKRLCFVPWCVSTLVCASHHVSEPW